MGLVDFLLGLKKRRKNHFESSSIAREHQSAINTLINIPISNLDLLVQIQANVLVDKT